MTKARDLGNLGSNPDAFATDSEVSSALTNYYTIAEADGLIASEVSTNLSNYYTSTQVDSAISSSISTELTSYYTSTEVDNAIAAIPISPAAYNFWSVKTSNYTAVSADQLACVGTFSVTLPSSPEIGNSIIISNVGTGIITVVHNGYNINSVADDWTISEDMSVQLVYINSTIGWKRI